MDFIKENKKIVTMTYPCNEQKRKNMTITKTQSPPPSNPSYISFANIKKLFEYVEKWQYDAELNNQPSNKKLLAFLKKNDITNDKHIVEHFIHFCRHIAYRIGCYKSQDHNKLKGDFKTSVIKDDYGGTAFINYNMTENKCGVKSIHTDSYNYIDASLYADKYFTIYSFLKMFVASDGKCFYCEKPFDITLTDKYMICKYNKCVYAETNVISKGGNSSIHDKNKQLRWSLERINNTLGHYQNNCVIACLGCNLKRRTKNHASFKFTQTLTLNKTE